MNWSTENHQLTKQFCFQNQTRLAEFLLLIAKHADTVGHHPDLFITHGNQLKVALITHDKNEITALDHALAATMDEIFSLYFR
jgi:4a-hydroxytetrahydrobiopterin dehydratase